MFAVWTFSHIHQTKRPNTLLQRVASQSPSSAYLIFLTSFCVPESMLTTVRISPLPRPSIRMTGVAYQDADYKHD